MFETHDDIVTRLDTHQRAFILAASHEPKPWGKIRKHAKIPDCVRVFGLTKPLEIMTTPEGRYYESALTPLGLRIKQQLLTAHRDST